MAQRNACLSGVLAALLLTGCSSISSMMDADRIDYKTSVEKQKTPRLEIPPDLTQIQRDERYAMPGGTVTASGYQKKQDNQPKVETIAIKSVGQDMRIERAGSQRWLVVNKSPEALWPQVKAFWQDAGFLINVEQPTTGVMETEWAENRAKLPQDIIRRTLGKVLDSLYSTGEMDKFRTRIERGPNGTSEIFISHRGAQEVLVGPHEERTVWTPRPSDPELEAELLTRLMVRLGGESVRAKEMMARGAMPQPQRAKLVKGDAKAESRVEVDEGFDRAWRRVGLALDRVGFTVEDRDRSKGLYFVRYVDQDKIGQEKAAKEKGWFSGWFSSGDKIPNAQRYRVYVKEAGQQSRVTVLNNDGQPERSAIGEKILSLLHEQLK